MSRIRIMSEALSNRIAAGEVIERPASVVKELVENAIDAGAVNVTVEIERAGIRRIAVRDDGSGMDADDALLCLEPHGTSKLLDASGIDTIRTLGFRGEAIPSIAAVSRFQLTTRRAEDAVATVVRAEGGNVLSAGPGAGAKGTSVEVRDLFFNTPARRKFLKSPGTEEQHIEEGVLLLAIGHCEVGFELIMDGKTAFRSAPGTSLEYRVRELMGRSYSSGLLPVSHKEGGLVIRGFIAAPGFTRIGRREQRTFINGRAVESPAIFRGIRDGYATLENDSGRYPPAILFLEMDPAEVDVNVHPAKREVRFKSEYAITRAVAAAVSAALRNDSDRLLEAASEVALPAEGVRALPLDGKVPLAMVMGGAEIHYRPAAPQPELKLTAEPLPEPESKPEDQIEALPESPEQAGIWLTDAEPKAQTPDGGSVPAEPETAEEPDDDPAHPVAAFFENWPETVLGIYDRTYILCSGRDGLVIVDQHAAHERVMFEKLLASVQKGDSLSQRLLLPQTLELTRPQANLLLRNLKAFEEIGFDLEPMGGGTVLVNALPLALQSQRGLDGVFADMLDELLDNSAAKLPVELQYLARAACKAAVKAHDPLTLTGAEELLRQLKACRQGTLCPHGRPTMVTVTRKELEKRFFRRG